MTESEIQSRIMLAVGARPDVRVFRNAVGEGWVGQVAQHAGDRLLLSHARRVRFGLAVGSPDIVGWRTVLITPDMVGRHVAQFLAVEVKTPAGDLAAGQAHFLDVLRAAGACAGVARSPAESLSIVQTPIGG